MALLVFEVSPHLARNTTGTVAEVHRLWQWVNRKNVMIKVPATKDGIPAIRQLIAEGINIKYHTFICTINVRESTGRVS